jgi:hypothetical protein
MEFKSQKEITQRLKGKWTPHPFALTSVGGVGKDPAGANANVNRYQRRGSRQDLREP